MVGTKVKILKICFSTLAEIVFLLHFLHTISAVFFVIKLVIFVLAYFMSNIALVLKGQKILFWSLLVRLGENFLHLIGLFFLYGKDKQKIFDNSLFFPH